MRQRHKYEELLPEEFYEERARAPVAYFACGGMEEHGLQSALGADPYIGYECCLRAAAHGGGIVFPVVPFAPAGVPGYTREELRGGRYALYPPSLWLSRETCKLLYEELLESFADLGFHACIAFGSHWPADLLMQEIYRERGGRVGGMRFWGGGLVSLMRDWLDDLERTDHAADGHGMMWETALVMAMRPDWVDLPRARRIMQSPLESQLQGPWPHKIERIQGATVEYGERWLAEAGERLARLATDLLGSQQP